MNASPEPLPESSADPSDHLGSEEPESPEQQAAEARRWHRWPPKVPDPVWDTLVAGGLMLAVGVLSLALDQPWLFPSLGPTAFLQAEIPERATSSFHNTVIGHLIGFAAGLVAVVGLGVANAPSDLATHHLTPTRMWAAALAVALTILFALLLRAPHPPAAATTLLVALGGFSPTFHDALSFVIGVLIVAILGEGLRRARLGEPALHFP